MICSFHFQSLNACFVKLNDEELKNRKKKNEVILELTKEFASIIEQKAIEYPYQWYNFHDFWYKGD